MRARRLEPILACCAARMAIDQHRLHPRAGWVSWQRGQLDRGRTV